MRTRKLIAILFAAVVLIIIIAAVILSALFFRYYKSAVETILGRTLGATVKIDSIYINTAKHTLHINNLKLYNPKGFDEDEILVHVPRITGKYNPDSALVNKKLHFTSLDIYVMGMVVIKNKNHKLNVEQLAMFKENFDELPIETDELILTADHVVFKDLTKGDRPHIEEFDVNIKNQAYEGFPTFEDITAKVTSEMLGRTTIKGAKILGVAVLLGSVGGWTAVIPAEAVIVMSEKGSYKATFDAGYEDVYKAALLAAHELGKDIYENKKDGIIKGYINDANVTIKIAKGEDNKPDVTVSAKKYYLPKLNIAGGVLYEIAEELQKNVQPDHPFIKNIKD